MPEFSIGGVRRASWDLQGGVPVVRVHGIGSFSPEQALDLADVIRECALDAQASSLVEPEFDLFSDAALARSSDPATSKEAAKAMRIRGASQKAELLRAYADAEHGLTDEEAGEISGLAASGAGYWKRCSELRNAGYIRRTNETRVGSTGLAQEVCVITEVGRAALMQATKESK